MQMANLFQHVFKQVKTSQWEEACPKIHGRRRSKTQKQWITHDNKEAICLYIPSCKPALLVCCKYSDDPCQTTQTHTVL